MVAVKRSNLKLKTQHKQGVRAGKKLAMSLGSGVGSELAKTQLAGN